MGAGTLSQAIFILSFLGGSDVNILNFIYLFINFWLHWVVLAVRRLTLFAASGVYSLAMARRPFIVLVSLVVEHRLPLASVVATHWL